MGQKEKLIERLKALPKDFTFAEGVVLLESLGFVESNKGKTSGSRTMFINKAKPSLKITLHKPHPQKELKLYAVKQLKEVLEQEGLI